MDSRAILSCVKIACAKSGSLPLGPGGAAVVASTLGGLSGGMCGNIKYLSAGEVVTVVVSRMVSSTTVTFADGTGLTATSADNPAAPGVATGGDVNYSGSPLPSPASAPALQAPAPLQPDRRAPWIFLERRVGPETAPSSRPKAENPEPGPATKLPA